MTEEIFKGNRKILYNRLKQIDRQSTALTNNDWVHVLGVLINEYKVKQKNLEKARRND